jgi:hypothetical protein
LIMFFGGAGLLVSYYIQLKIDERKWVMYSDGAAHAV